MYCKTYVTVCSPAGYFQPLLCLKLYSQARQRVVVCLCRLGQGSLAELSAASANRNKKPRTLLTTARGTEGLGQLK